MKDVLLIDVEGIKKLGYVHDNVLPKTIQITIRRVQRVMLRRLMGSKAYDDLVSAVSASLPPTVPIVPLTADQIELLEEYIHPYLAACVDYKIVYPLTLRSRSKSVGKGTDENHEAADLEGLKVLRDQMMKDVDAFAEALKEKLEGNCSADSTNTKTPWNAIKFR